MKVLFTLLCLFSGFFVSAQSHSLALRNSVLSLSGNLEKVEIDSLNVIPFSESSLRSFRHDIGYKRENEKGNGVVIRLGVRQFYQSGNQMTLSSNGTDYLTSSFNQRNLNYLIHTGGFLRVFTKDKFSSQIGSELIFIYQPDHLFEATVNQFEANDFYVGGSVVTIDVPRTLGVGLNFNGNFYYALFKNLSIGLEIGLEYLYENEKGSRAQRTQTYNAQREVIWDSSSPSTVNNHQFSKQFISSLGLQYRFGKS